LTIGPWTHFEVGNPVSIGELTYPANVLMDIDPDEPAPTLGGGNLSIPSGPLDQPLIEARDDVLVSTTANLSHPLTVMHQVSMSLWMIPDTTDLDLAVRLSEAQPSGHSMLVTNGIQLVRMRCSDGYGCFLTPG
jgi:predicted acyl esterase